MTIIFPRADALDTRDERQDYSLALYLIPAGERDDGLPCVTTHGGIGNIGTPAHAWHGRWVQIGTLGARAVGETVLAALKEVADDLEALSDAYEGSAWDGNNHKGVWSDDYPRLVDGLHRSWEAAAAEIAYAWEAADWLASDRTDWVTACQAAGVDPERGEDAVEAVVAWVESTATDEYLSGTEDAVMSLLEDWQAEREDDEDEDDESDVTDEQLVALMAEAGAAGDPDMADMAEAALEGDKAARARCAAVIADAKAQG